MRVLYVSYALWKSVVQSKGFAQYHKVVEAANHAMWAGDPEIVYAANATGADYTDWQATFAGTSTAVPLEDEALGNIAGLGTPLLAKSVLYDAAGAALAVNDGRLSPPEFPTFVLSATGTALGNNKSMVSLLNVDAAKVVKVREVWIVNVATTAVTGVIATFEARRFTGHSGGSVLTPQSHDPADALDADITAKTGSVIAGESASLLWRRLWSSDEWGVGTLDTEAAQVSNQEMWPTWTPTHGQKPITLRQNNGITIKCATNTTAGTFDVIIVFTVE